MNNGANKNSKNFIYNLTVDKNDKNERVVARNGKYNDYFDNSNKPSKRLIDISKNSAESNSSIKSIKS